jgi:hypothetical protein
MRTKDSRFIALSLVVNLEALPRLVIVIVARAAETKKLQAGAVPHQPTDLERQARTPAWSGCSLQSSGCLAALLCVEIQLRLKFLRFGVRIAEGDRFRTDLRRPRHSGGRRVTLLGWLLAKAQGINAAKAT